ncbi:OmpH family outer membrane protein [Brevundimonas sp. GCM10030266]|uniref:OmpH family outer membrane protein n=1 Tax=Brevundimonas sp. GCM10030266 TaxID=3273386 RepID=UPI00360D910B
MSIRMLTLAAVVATLAPVAATPAMAQTIGGARGQAAPAAPEAQPLGGPLVPGVCLLSREAVFANAAAGRAASARLQEITLAAQAEIDAVRQPLEAEAQAFETQAASLPEAQRNERQQALLQRVQALQAQAAHNAREVEATRMAAMSRIADAAQPVIAEVYASKNCGLLFDRGSALGGNFGNDLTAGVVAALDARLPTLTFERERLPLQPAGTAQ